ncbi:MAG: hypothetical protein RIE32_00550 [Phycisphaerales bacterium]
MTPWIFLALAWVLGVGGVLLLAWALVGDRARGRTRCPKCWHDLSGASPEAGPVVCPECGRRITRVRSLRRARRRWRWAALACVMIIGAVASRSWHVARVHDWWRVAPDAVLIACLPRTEAWCTQSWIGSPGAVLTSARTGPYKRELYERWAPVEHAEGAWRHGGLNAFERWLLGRRAAAWLRSAEESEFRYVACEMLAWATDENPPGLSPEDLGMLVLARSRLAYQTAATYMDIGVQVEDWSRIEPDDALHYTMVVSGFQRGVGTRFECSTASADFVDSDWRSSRHSVTLQRAGGPTRTWDHDGELPPDDDPPAPYWVSLHPAEALDADGLWGSVLRPQDYEDWLARPAMVRGRACYYLAEPWPDIELWIDPDTWLVLRVREDSIDLHIEPTLDARFDDAWWRFDPADPADTPLEQRLHEIDALLPDANVLEGYTRRRR